jgi:cardiolipin synthase
MLNLPNFLSVGRILSVPLIVILLIYNHSGWALLVFILAAISDAVDGLLARLLHQRTAIGAYLDPAADKLLTSSTFIALSILKILPGWLAVIVISRDVIICLGLVILFFTSHPLEIKPSLTSKLTTVFQLCTVIFALFFNYTSPIPIVMNFLIWGTVIMTIISGMQYIGKGIKIFNKDTH